MSQQAGQLTPETLTQKFASSNEDLRLLVDNISEYAIILLDPQGHVTTWNKGAERLKGYRSDEIIGKHCSIFYPPEDIKGGKPEHELTVAAETGRFEDEGWRVRKDGKPFWAYVVITALRDKAGELRGYGEVTRDMTERKQAENDLRQFRTLVDNMDDYAIYLLDTSGRVLTWNKGAERIKGYKAKEIIGRHISVFLPPEDVQQGKADLELETAEKTGRFEDENWRIRKDGSRLWANVIITALRDADGRLLGFSKITRDLTQRKEMEEHLRGARDELEKRVQDRTAELNNVNAELQDELENRKQMEEVVRSLSTPVLPLRDRLLILPIIGVIDSTRALQLTEQLLNSIRLHRAKAVVMDVTGVAIVDSKVANHLLQTVEAARLMGASVIVTGLSPEISQTLVRIGVDLSRLTTVGDLRGGLEEAEQLLGYTLVANSPAE